MSLTNRMLKNLEQRQVDRSTQESITSDLNSAQEDKRLTKLGLYISLAVAVAVVIAISGAYLYLQWQRMPLAKPKITPVAAKVTELKSHPQRQVIQMPKPVEHKPAVQAPGSIIEASKSLPPVAAVALPSPKETIKVEQSEKVLIKTAPVVSVEDQSAEDYQDALNLIAEGKNREAIAVLQRALLAAPENEAVRTTLATVLLQQGRNKDAEILLTEGLVLKPNSFGMAELYARALIAQNQYDKALHALLQIGDSADNDSDYLSMLATVYQHLNRPADAIGIYQQLLNQEPSNARWLVGLGASLEQMGNDNAALQAFQKAQASRQLTPELMSYVTQRIRALGGAN